MTGSCFMTFSGRGVAVMPMLVCGLLIGACPHRGARWLVTILVLAAALQESGIVQQFQRDGRFLGDRNQDWRAAVQHVRHDLEHAAWPVLVRISGDAGLQISINSTEPCERFHMFDGNAMRIEEIGDLMFVLANFARHCGVDPEAALRGANAKFERRFGHVEASLRASGKSPQESSLEEMDALWDEAKEMEKRG